MIYSSSMKDSSFFFRMKENKRQLQHSTTFFYSLKTEQNHCCNPETKHCAGRAASRAESCRTTGTLSAGICSDMSAKMLLYVLLYGAKRRKTCLCTFNVQIPLTTFIYETKDVFSNYYCRI